VTDPDWLRGDWMQTYTGKQFWPMDPRASEIDPDDIAHALSLLCRYGGHCSEFYSVAEHCVLMSHAVSPENALTALLHDASEAYLVDVPRPIKRSPKMEAYRVAEARMMDAIAVRFGLSDGSGDWWYTLPTDVKQADTRILVDERARLMSLGRDLDWGLDAVEPLGVKIQCWSPAIAEEQWRIRLNELIEG
jgi:hypothetical protein